MVDKTQAGAQSDPMSCSAATQETVNVEYFKDHVNIEIVGGTSDERRYCGLTRRQAKSLREKLEAEETRQILRDAVRESVSGRLDGVPRELLESIDSLLSWIAHRGWRVDLEEDRRRITDYFIPELRRLTREVAAERRKSAAR